MSFSKNGCLLLVLNLCLVDFDWKAGIFMIFEDFSDRIGLKQS